MENGFNGRREKQWAGSSTTNQNVRRLFLNFWAMLEKMAVNTQPTSDNIFMQHTESAECKFALGNSIPFLLLTLLMQAWFQLIHSSSVLSCFKIVL